MSTKKRFSLISDKETDNTPIKSTQNTKIKSQPLYFQKHARYRCSQDNFTRLLEDITFSANIKTQYLVSIAKTKEDIFHVLLEDYLYMLNPKEMETAFQITEPIAYIRNDIEFTQNQEGQIKSILNLNKIKKKWNTFKKEELPNIDFYQKLGAEDPKIMQDIIINGNKEFGSDSVLSQTLSKNLFYHILLKANASTNLKDFQIAQLSQIFPNQMLNIDVKILSTTQGAETTFRLVGELDQNNLNIEKIKEQYDEIYKPIIQYKFTEFSYSYRIKYTINNQTNVITEATATLIEKIKNNFESVTQFDLKKVEL